MCVAKDLIFGRTIASQNWKTAAFYFSAPGAKFGRKSVEVFNQQRRQIQFREWAQNISYFIDTFSIETFFLVRQG